MILKQEVLIMADNRQNVTQILENGSVVISEEVLCTIVEQALKDVEGIIGLSSKPGADIAEVIGKKNWGKGLQITVNEDESLTVDVNILAEYGQSVVSAASAVQSAVTVALESMTGCKVNTVNVNVCGIARK